MADCETYVALLRGVNVGGKHILPMKDLSEIVAKCKCRDVRTYIQSGNVVFAASRDVAEKLPLALAKRIQERLGSALRSSCVRAMNWPRWLATTPS